MKRRRHRNVQERTGFSSEVGNIVPLQKGIAEPALPVRNKACIAPDVRLHQLSDAAGGGRRRRSAVARVEKGRAGLIGYCCCSSCTAGMSSEDRRQAVGAPVQPRTTLLPITTKPTLAKFGKTACTKGRSRGDERIRQEQKSRVPIQWLILPAGVSTARWLVGRQRSSDHSSPNILLQLFFRAEIQETRVSIVEPRRIREQTVLGGNPKPGTSPASTTPALRSGSRKTVRSSWQPRSPLTGAGSLETPGPV